MFRLDDTWVTSPTDVVGALRCEYGFLRTRAEKAGLVEPVQPEDDPLLARASRLGDAHERRTLEWLVDELGRGTIGRPGGVIEIERPSTRSRAALVEAHEATVAALAGGADVVFQAAFFDGRRHGLADFVVRAEGDDGTVRYEPADTKLARRAKVEALLQVADYAEHLIDLGQPEPREVHLWLGDGAASSHRLADLRPVLVDRRARIDALLDVALAVPSWGDPTLRHCGWCDHCRAAIAEHRDLW
ncbi:MAG: hypothetical protein KDA97_13145, partial [Acidimicrobiales bacterium]|nr:hypothetical protein [Acidimicrobiales bacterium]